MRRFCCRKYVGRYSCEAGRMVLPYGVLIDGNRTVQEIISLLADHFQNEDNYPSQITTLYYAVLQKDGFIQLKVES